MGGGGVPNNKVDKVWSYLYSTAEFISEPLTRAAVEDPTDVRKLDNHDVPGSLSSLTSWEGAGTAFEGLSPKDGMVSLSDPLDLAGLGCGLPLSRLYARYLGGKIELQTLPRYGTDVFVYISRLGVASDNLPML